MVTAVIAPTSRAARIKQRTSGDAGVNCGVGLQRTFLPALISAAARRLRSVCKSWVQAAGRKRAGRRGLALLVTRELAVAGVPVIPALQAVRIITSARRRSGRNDRDHSCQPYYLAHP